MTISSNVPDKRRGLLERATNPPGSKSPIEFDAYSLNHAAFVGLNEVAWTTEFEQELTRRKVYVNKGSSAFKLCFLQVKVEN